MIIYTQQSQKRDTLYTNIVDSVFCCATGVTGFPLQPPLIPYRWKKLRVFGSHQASHRHHNLHLLLLKSRVIYVLIGALWLSQLFLSPSALKATHFMEFEVAIMRRSPMGSPVSDGDHVVLTSLTFLHCIFLRGKGFSLDTVIMLMEQNRQSLIMCQTQSWCMYRLVCHVV